MRFLVRRYCTDSAIIEAPTMEEALTLALEYTNEQWEPTDTTFDAEPEAV